jgi:galactonate dehydratase
MTYLQDAAPFDLEDGMIKALEAPGLGIVIDEARVRHAAAAPHRWRNPVWRGRDGSLREW